MDKGLDGSAEAATPTPSASENRERVCQQCGGTATKKGPVEYCLDSGCPTKSIQPAANGSDLQAAAIAVFDAFHDTAHIGECSSAPRKGERIGADRSWLSANTVPVKGATQPILPFALSVRGMDASFAAGP